MRNISKIIDKSNKEFAANISFADDPFISPNGIDITNGFSAITGERWQEICTKLGPNKFRIEIKR